MFFFFFFVAGNASGKLSINCPLIDLLLESSPIASPTEADVKVDNNPTQDIADIDDSILEDDLLVLEPSPLEDTDDDVKESPGAFSFFSLRSSISCNTTFCHLHSLSLSLSPHELVLLQTCRFVRLIKTFPFASGGANAGEDVKEDACPIGRLTTMTEEEKIYHGLNGEVVAGLEHCESCGLNVENQKGTG
jgi:hypothetical protein